MNSRLKKVTTKDILGIFKFLLVLIPALIYKTYLSLAKKELWLICEMSEMARDNGYAFYKYMKSNQKEITTYYAINKKCSDYQKVSQLGNIIEWSSLKHYFYYMSATLNISSHKEGNPNHTLFTILHLYLNLYNNRVFLQHGVLYQNFYMFHRQNTKFKIFITGTKPEYEFVKNKYEYKKDEVKYTGLARFDYLQDKSTNKDIILYMPTWRRTLTKREELINSLYYKRIMSLINNKELDTILEKNNKYFYFCPHGGLKNVKDAFTTNNKRVKIIDIEKADIQNLLKMGSLLITDFSSLQTDFAFMNKPILYYQYDEKFYQEKHIGTGAYDTYFDFNRDGFGEVINEENDLINAIDKNIQNNFILEEKYKERISKCFVLHDKNNCERIFKYLTTSNNEYKEYLKQDKERLKKYGIAKKLYYRLTFNQHMRYQKIITISRKRNYYRNKKGLINTLARIILDIKYNLLSTKLNIFLDGEFGKNLKISHENVILNRYAKLGNDVILHGNNCIGNGNNGKKDSPIIGNRVDIGYGATIIGGIEIADDITIGANALVNKSFNEKGMIIAGVPAKKIKDGKEI